MGFLSKGPNSNDPPRESRSSRWLEENDLMDEVALVLNGMAKRCASCRQAVRVKYLDEQQRCPDCR